MEVNKMSAQPTWKNAPFLIFNRMRLQIGPQYRHTVSCHGITRTYLQCPVCPIHSGLSLSVLKLKPVLNRTGAVGFLE